MTEVLIAQQHCVKASQKSYCDGYIALWGNVSSLDSTDSITVLCTFNLCAFGQSFFLSVAPKVVYSVFLVHICNTFCQFSLITAHFKKRRPLLFDATIACEFHACLKYRRVMKCMFNIQTSKELANHIYIYVVTSAFQRHQECYAVFVIPTSESL